MEINAKAKGYSGRQIVTAITGAILGIAFILVTLEIARRGIILFVANQQRYIVSVEVALLGLYLTEMLARISSLSLRAPERKQITARFRIVVRTVGYVVVGVSVISILASNSTLGISVGAVTGVVVAFATQNIVGNFLAAIVIFNTRMVNIGEEISVTGIKGIVTDFGLSHTKLEVDDDVVYVPNLLMISSTVRRKKR
jgi:small conductance mechanosensitive channel